MTNDQELAHMVSNTTVEDLAHLEGLLKRKLLNIPEHVITAFTISDILIQIPCVLITPTVPSDIQISFLLRNRALVDRHGGRPIKDENQQSSEITRAIFFYHLHEPHQFQRYHDLSRWNLALFAALLSSPPTSPTALIQSSHQSQARVHKPEYVTSAAKRFMRRYLAAVMERHNTPTVFKKREDFVKRWKESSWDLFERFGASQRKLMKREMQRLNAMWEVELDRAMKVMGRREYERCVAPFVGCIIPGRKDQQVPVSLGASVRPASSSPMLEREEQMHVVQEGNNDLLDALRVPLGEPNYQDDHGYDKDATTPVDMRYAISRMQDVRPVDILPVLMRLFPVG
jgi:hypothetical protein